MRAITFSEFGPPAVLKLSAADKPKPGPGEVLIRVRAAGVNPIDSKIRSGKAAARFDVRFPAIPGWECSGEVAALHAENPVQAGDLPPLKVGSRVFAYSRPVGEPGAKLFIERGCYAEFVALPAAHIALLPDKVDIVDGAATPLAGLTALQALEALQLGEGKTVLIQAAAGGVGHFAVQLAKLVGARMIGTASKKNHGWLKKLGCDELIDYKAHDFATELRKKHPQGVDAVLDSVGGDTLLAGLDCLREGGRLVSLVQPVTNLKKPGREAIYVFVQPNAVQLAHLGALLAEGKLKPRIAREFDLKDAAKAHALIEKHHVAGKLVLTT
ncbi:enoyl reductase [Planctomycetaceae bacterium]|nr:enoyl reductase [Planctomycetaceae bacterium]